MNRSQMDVITGNKNAPKADLLSVVNNQDAPSDVLLAVLKHPKLNNRWNPLENKRVTEILISIGAHPNADNNKVRGAMNNHRKVNKAVLAAILERRGNTTAVAAPDLADVSASSSSVGSGDGSHVVAPLKDDHRDDIQIGGGLEPSVVEDAAVSDRTFDVRAYAEARQQEIDAEKKNQSSMLYIYDRTLLNDASAMSPALGSENRETNTNRPVV